MNRYEFLQTVHVFAAIAWLGSALCVQVLAVRANRTRDPERKRQVSDDAEWLATRIFIPASLTVLIFGILLVLDGPWEFDQAWILIGLAGYAFSFLTGILYLSPESGRIKRALEGGAVTEAEARTRRIFIVSRVELTILFIVAADMVAKPWL